MLSNKKTHGLDKASLDHLCNFTGIDDLSHFFYCIRDTPPVAALVGHRPVGGWDMPLKKTVRGYCQLTHENLFDWADITSENISCLSLEPSNKEFVSI